jgi:hypothetical protein
VVRLPRVEGGDPGRVEHARVDEGPFSAGGRDRVQHGVLLAWRTPGEELPLASPDRRAYLAGAKKFAEPRGELLESRHGREVARIQILLRR